MNIHTVLQRTTNPSVSHRELSVAATLILTTMAAVIILLLSPKATGRKVCALNSQCTALYSKTIPGVKGIFHINGECRCLTSPKQPCTRTRRAADCYKKHYYGPCHPRWISLFVGPVVCVRANECFVMRGGDDLIVISL